MKMPWGNELGDRDEKLTLGRRPSPMIRRERRALHTIAIDNNLCAPRSSDLSNVRSSDSRFLVVFMADGPCATYICHNQLLRGHNSIRQPKYR